MLQYVAMGFKKPRKTNKHEMGKAVNEFDDKVAYDEFKRSLLPLLREELLAGASAEEIRKKYEPYAAARLIQIAVTSDNESAAVTAGKDIQDRSSGKPKEHKRVDHLLAQLPSQEFEALLLSEMASIEEATADDDDDTEEG